MKKLFFVLVITPLLLALTNVPNPILPTQKYGKGSTVYIHEVCKYETDLVLHKIEFEETKTTVTLRYRVTTILWDSSFVFMNTLDTMEAYVLQELETGKRYRNYKSNVGLTWDTPTYLVYGQVIDIHLEFPPIPRTMTKFTLTEKMHGGQWDFYSLDLRDYINNKEHHFVYEKNEALKLVLQKDYKKAYSVIKKYLDKNPNDADAHNIASGIANHELSVKKAEKHIDKALSLDPTNHNYHELKCYMLFKKDEVALALEQLDSAILYCPTQPGFYSIRAGCFINAKKYEAAIEDYTKLIGFHRYTKRLTEMYYNRAYCYVLLDNKEYACSDFKAGLKYGKTESDKFLFKEMIKEHCGREKRL